MSKVKVFTGRLAASAVSVVLAASAVGGFIFPTVTPLTTYAESQSDTDVSLSMGLSAGGSVIGISLYISAEEDLSDHTITLDGVEQTPEETSQGWKITAKEYAMDMGNTHTVVVKKGGKTLLEKEISVSDYLHTIINDDKYKKYQPVAKAMLRYGGAAQKYFGVNADSPVDSDITGADISNVSVTGEEFDSESFNSTLASKPVSYYGMNLSLRSETTFSLFFEISSDSDKAAATEFLNGFTFDGAPVTAEENSENYLAVSMNVPASALSKEYEFTNGKISVKFSPSQYLKTATGNSDEKLVNVCKALYAYGKAAEEVPQQSEEENNDPEPLLEPKGTIHSGEATYYTLAGQGNAMIDDIRGKRYYAAMNTEDYNTAMLAGAYVEVTGPKGSVNVYISDRLPEGKKGDIDLDPDAFDQIAEHKDGRVDVTWKIIPLDTADDKPMSFRFKNNEYNQWFTEIQVYDQKYPIYSLEYLNSNGEYVNIPRMEYNYFKDENGIGASPYTFRITDIYGHVVIEENIDLSSGGPVEGTVQFPD